MHRDGQRVGAQHHVRAGAEDLRESGIGRVEGGGREHRGDVGNQGGAAREPVHGPGDAAVAELGWFSHRRRLPSRASPNRSGANRPAPAARRLR